MIDIREPRWFAAYTKSRNEKQVQKRLEEEGIETYLPLQKKVKQWSDRKKIIEEPVLRSYIFVRITEKEYYHVLKVWGVVRFVCFEGKAAPIPDTQITLLKRLLGEGLDVEEADGPIEPVEMIEVCSGSLMGLVGEMIEHRGRKKVVVRLDSHKHSLLVTLPKNYITRRVKE